jgi:hypothetical protein
MPNAVPDALGIQAGLNVPGGLTENDGTPVNTAVPDAGEFAAMKPGPVTQLVHEAVVEPLVSNAVTLGMTLATADAVNEKVPCCVPFAPGAHVPTPGIL